MALKLDLTKPDKLTKTELEYLSQREYLIREAEYQGASNIRQLIADRNSKADEADEPDEDDEEELDYEDLKVDDLKVELLERGLSASGTKAELVARLEEDDAAE